MKTNPFNMALHLKWRAELLITMVALRQVSQIKILLFLRINVTLNVRHQTYVVIQHFVTIPALKPQTAIIIALAHNTHC
jgi:hypothetical protein